MKTTTLERGGPRATSTVPSSARSRKARTVRWVVAHARDDKSFSEQLDAFARKLSERSAGMLKVRFSHSDIGKGDDEADAIAFKQLLDGAADMGQITTGRLAVRAVESPCLFRGYLHAEAVWRGAIGRELLSDVSAGASGRLRGLAFSYSGGFRVFVGQRPIRKAGDFEGLRVRDVEGGYSTLLGRLGARLVKVGRAEMPAAPLSLPATGKVDVEETEVNRLAYAVAKYPDLMRPLKFVNMTRHAMLVTGIVAAEPFLSSLTEPERALLSDEVRALALAERRLSIALAEKNLKLLANAGMQVVEMPGAEWRALADRARDVHEGYSTALSALVARIRSVEDLAKL